MEVKFTLMMDVHVVLTAPVIKYFVGTLIATEANAINPHHSMLARVAKGKVSDRMIG